MDSSDGGPTRSSSLGINFSFRLMVGKPLRIDRLKVPIVSEVLGNAGSQDLHVLW